MVSEVEEVARVVLDEDSHISPRADLEEGAFERPVVHGGVTLRDPVVHGEIVDVVNLLQFLRLEANAEDEGLDVDLRPSGQVAFDARVAVRAAREEVVVYTIPAVHSWPHVLASVSELGAGPREVEFSGAHVAVRVIPLCPPLETVELCLGRRPPGHDNRLLCEAVDAVESLP